MKINCKNLTNPIVIAGFPGIGKTEFFKDHLDRWNVFDSDSSKFKTNWPNDYLDHIEKLVNNDYDKLTFILTSTHTEVLKGMIDRDIKFTAISPEATEECFKKYILRYEKRNSTKEFISNMEKNFYEYIKSMHDICKFSPLCWCLTLDQNMYLSTYIVETVYSMYIYDFGFYPFGIINNDRVSKINIIKRKINYIQKCIRYIKSMVNFDYLTFNPYLLITEYDNLCILVNDIPDVECMEKLIILKGDIDKLRIQLKLKEFKR